LGRFYVETLPKVETLKADDDSDVVGTRAGATIAVTAGYKNRTVAGSSMREAIPIE